MHKNRFLSQAVENTEPTKNQSFTDLLAELRAAQVSWKRILTILVISEVIIEISECVKKNL